MKICTVKINHQNIKENNNKIIEDKLKEETKKWNRKILESEEEIKKALKELMKTMSFDD
jgi:hypoxanthine phosphoribosyltransferase